MPDATSGSARRISRRYPPSDGHHGLPSSRDEGRIGRFTDPAAVALARFGPRRYMYTTSGGVELMNAARIRALSIVGLLVVAAAALAFYTMGNDTQTKANYDKTCAGQPGADHDKTPG